MRNVLKVLKEGRRSSKKTEQTRYSNDGEDDKSGHSGETAKVRKVDALFAELLLRSKEFISKEQSQLEHDFEEASKEAKEARMMVFKAMREEEKIDGCALPEELVACFNKAGFEDHVEMELLKEELLSKLREAENDHKNVLQGISSAADVKKMKKSDEEVSSSSDSSFRDTFEKIVEQWEKKSKHGGTSALMNRLRVELPSVSTQRLSLILNQYNSSRMSKMKTQDATTNYQRKVKQIIDWAVKAVEATRVSILKKVEQEAVAVVNGMMKEDLLARLQVLRAEREEAHKLEAQRQKIAQEEKRLIEMAAAEKKAEEQEHSRKLVEEYKLSLERQKRDMEEKQKSMDAEMERERLKRMEINEERVTYREILNRERMRQVEHELELKKISEREKLERLSKLAASVPYYDRILNASADLSKTTVARANDIYEEDLTGLYSFQQGDGKLTSFTNEKVFSDLKFRLGAALHAAGVAQSAASKAVVRKLVPRMPERTTGIGLR